MAWEIKGELITDGPMVVGSVVKKTDACYRVEIGQHVRELTTLAAAIAFARGVESAQAQVKAVMAQLYMLVQANGGKMRLGRGAIEKIDMRTAVIMVHTDPESGDYVYETGNV